MPFWVRVYGYDTSVSSAFSGQYKNWTAKVEGLSFSTKNPGGYSECDFSVALPSDEAADIYSTYHHYFVEIGAGSGFIAWQGRIQNIALEPGRVRIKGYGLWTNAFDQYYDDGSFDPSPVAENGIANRDAWTPLNATYEQVAQSFTVASDDDAAMQDCQFRLSRTGNPEGVINFELRRSTEGGTLVASNTMPASNAKADPGFSEWLGLTSDAKIGAATYYLIAWGDATYMASVDGSNYVAVGRDTTGSYGGGLARYYNGSIWQDLGGDLIFYIWLHPKWYHSDSTYADEIIGSIISECIFIQDETAFLSDTGIISTPIKFASQEKHGDAIAKLISFGSSGATPEPLFFGVYEGGYAHLRKFTDGNTWWLDAKEIAVNKFSLSSDLGGYRTRTSVLYSDEDGVRGKTPWNVNSNVYDMFGYHRDGLFNLSGATEAIAESISDLIGNVYVVPEQKISLLIDGMVATASGARVPSWYVRAGDIIKVRNLIPSGAVVSDEMADRLDTLYIQETSYNTDSGSLTAVPTAETSALLDIILTLAGLSGGSIQ
jgi:hypothetical protein